MTAKMAKIEGDPDQPYRNSAQAIAHVAEMFDLAHVELAKRQAAAA